MPTITRCLLASVLLFCVRLGTAQIGSATGGSNSLLSCQTTSAGAPLLRPEGYTEQIGDILIVCTGGPVPQQGSNIPTTNIVVYMAPAVPITSRFMSTNGASEALLIIDEAGSNITTGVAGNFGPKAPQVLCTNAQQQAVGGSTCNVVVGQDPGTVGGPYTVAVPGPGNGASSAQNVYQGKIGDFGTNSVAFYNVPVLPPSTGGVSRVFRITNIRIAVPGGNLVSTVNAGLSTSPFAVLPVSGAPVTVGRVGPSMSATIDSAPPGGGNPFVYCVSQSNALAARVTFTEGFATSFRTRVVPGGAASGTAGANYLYSAQAQNLSPPFNQNIPGSTYNNFAANSESGFIFPALNATISGISYTAGLSDYGTRLKATFTYVTPGTTLSVSTTNTPSYSMPGGTSVTPYAVLVAANPNNDAGGDGPTFVPLQVSAIGSDGLPAYPLPVDSSLTATAVWEVLNANPTDLDSLTFSVYLSYSASLMPDFATASLSFAPEPSDGTFPTSNATAGLSSPFPRFGVLSQQGGGYFNPAAGSCVIDASRNPVAFTYSIGDVAPASVNRPVTLVPSNYSVTLTRSVSTPPGGNWLSASLNGGTLTISAHPEGLPSSGSAYTGTVTLSSPTWVPGEPIYPDIVIPVSLTVNPPVSGLAIAQTHSANFTQGQWGATYSIVVSNSPSAQAASGLVTVTEQVPAGLTLMAMTGTGWDCSVLPACKRSDSLAPGAQYPPIFVTVNVASYATTPLISSATVSGGSSSPATANDSTVILNVCQISGVASVSVADIQGVINEALGSTATVHDLDHDGLLTIMDVQKEINAALGLGCSY